MMSVCENSPHSLESSCLAWPGSHSSSTAVLRRKLAKYSLAAAIVLRAMTHSSHMVSRKVRAYMVSRVATKSPLSAPSYSIESSHVLQYHVPMWILARPRIVDIIASSGSTLVDSSRTMLHRRQMGSAWVSCIVLGSPA